VLVVWVDVLVLVVVVFFAAVVVCVVVTGGVGPVVVDLVVVVVVTGATGVTGALVVVTGARVLGAAAAVVVVEAGGFLRWCFLWCAARLRGVAATDDVVLDVVEEVELVDVVDEDEALVPPELPQPAITRPPISVSSAAFMHPPLVSPRLAAKANNA
jgi:hypothetical protein